MNKSQSDYEEKSFPTMNDKSIPTNSHQSSKKFNFEKMKEWYRQLPDKKRYIEFLTAILTVPVLLTVIISNVQSLQRQNEQNTKITPTSTHVSESATPTPKTIYITVSPTPIPIISNTPTTTPSEQCKKEIGPISIVYPEEATTISKNPVCLDISRTGIDYCAVVWSYRINNESWSDYTDKSICLYGLPPGAKKLELRIKSIVTGDETILTRNFTVYGSTSPTPISSSSASMQ